MSDLFLLQNNQIVDLFEIKLNDFEGFLRFHGSKNYKNDLVYNGQIYLYIPCELSQLSYSSEGKQSRPTLTIANINNFITNVMKDRSSLLGRRLSRKRVMARDLDNINFGGENKNPFGQKILTSYISSDTFVINKKDFEDRDKVEFTLSNILDTEGLTVPNRKIYNNFCQWQYRGCGCNYGKIYNYDGPIVRVMNDTQVDSVTFEPKTLKDICDDEGISSNCFLWLDEDGHNLNNPLTEIQTANLLSYTEAQGNIAIAGTATPDINTAGISKGTHYDKDSGAGLFLKEWIDRSYTIRNSGSAKTVSTNSNNFAMRYRSESRKPLNDKVNGNEALWGIRLYPNVGWYSDSLGNYVKDSTSEVVFDAVATDIDAADSFTIFFVSELVNKYYDIDKNIISSDEMFGVIGGQSTNPSDLTIGTQIKKSSSDATNQADYLSVSATAGGTQQVYSSSPAFSDNFNETKSYCVRVDKTKSGNEIDYFINSIKKVTGSLPSGWNGLTGYGFNLSNTNYNNAAGEFVLYEFIVFDSALTDKQIGEINKYLATRYGRHLLNLPTQAQESLPNGSVPSKIFFSDQDGNLGIPMADASDKSFLKDIGSAKKYTNDQTYGLSSLKYRGDFDINTQYSQMDFVKIDPSIDFDFDKTSIKKEEEIPSRFFVCISENGSKGLDPMKNTNIWVEDQCSKTLNGCSLRFSSSDSAQQINLPFGGFPGTVDYDYQLPSS